MCALSVYCHYARACVTFWMRMCECNAQTHIDYTYTSLLEMPSLGS